MKKVLLLGGSQYLLPVIDACHKLGYQAITCDYLPDNIAHKYADESHTVSIIEKYDVLSLAEKIGIDGIMSFACDPGVVTAAYVAEKLNLHFQCSYEVAKILQDKGKFRKFLNENGFHCPYAKSYTSISEAMNDVKEYPFPVIIKPVDSAGSKGVTKVDSEQNLVSAMNIALSESRSGRFIVEEFITFEGHHSSVDCFVIDGKLEFCDFSDQLFDANAENAYVPASVIYPSTMKQEHQDYLTLEIQRLITLLGLSTGIYNIETCVGIDGKPYIMEVSPRGGGAHLAAIQKFAYGIDFIAAEIESAVGDPVTQICTHDIQKIDGYWCSLILHSNSPNSGILKEIQFDSEFEHKHIRKIYMQVQEGDIVEPFTGANKTLGVIFLHFDTREELDFAMSHQDEWCRIILK